MGREPVTPFLSDPGVTLWHGDALEVLRELPTGSVDAVVTSPPYMDARPEYSGPDDFGYMLLFRELARVVAGPMLWNVGRLWRDGIEQLWWTRLLAHATDAGWELWDTLVWGKPNANPIHGRVFSNSHEYVLVMGRAGDSLNEDGVRRPHAPSTVARFGRAWTNHKGVKSPIASKARKQRVEPNALGARPRSYIEICVGKEKGNAHPAPMALDLATYLVTLAVLPGQAVLDPFAGSCTTLLAARSLERRSVGIERDAAYCAMGAVRLNQLSLLADSATATAPRRSPPISDDPDACLFTEPT